MKRKHIGRTLPPTTLDVDDGVWYLDREISWLRFNERVLNEAYDERNPLLERLKFLGIACNNLDEYFMVRVAVLPEESIAAIRAELQPSLHRQMRLLRDELLPKLAQQGVALLTLDALTVAQRQRLRTFFIERVFPVLTPLVVDSRHPFPYISNLTLSLAVELDDSRSHGASHRFARVKVPSNLPRFVRLEPNDGDRLCYVLLEELIVEHLALLFPGVRVCGAWPFRVTRDADIDVNDASNDETQDVLRAVEQGLRRRRFGEPVRLEVVQGMPESTRDWLMHALDLTPNDCYVGDGLLGVADFRTLAALELPALRDPSFIPTLPRCLREDENLFSVIRRGDVLLHHPYESFDPVVNFVAEAARDPRVLAIKQTLYRTSGAISPIYAALTEAAEQGKQVAVVVELKARFEEENNIAWARRLEKVGAHVVYGSPLMKTHAKLTLVVREEDDGICHYLHLGTGNYNERTARLYTDLSLFTADPEMGRDATTLFNTLTGLARTDAYERFLVAPHTLRQRLLSLIEREAAHARAGRPSSILAKMNALSDRAIVHALYLASQAGVSIRLIVRGICILRPGVPGISEHIMVRSVIGRFLEHSRIMAFSNGGRREVFIGSADWMSRNLDRRVELMVPIQDPVIADRLVHELTDVFWAETARAYALQADGSYLRTPSLSDVDTIDVQEQFLRRAARGD